MIDLEVRARVRVEAELSPSEDPQKVMAALRNVVGGLRGEEGLDARSARLATDDARASSHIRDQLRDRHVRASARRQLLLNEKGRTTFMMLNRQAATAGVVAICGSPEESPLGPIYVIIESDDVTAAIDWVTGYAGG